MLGAKLALRCRCDGRGLVDLSAREPSERAALSASSDGTGPSLHISICSLLRSRELVQDDGVALGI
jgi:hypothetical protein